MTPLLTRVGTRRQRVWLGSRIVFLAETRTQVAIAVWPGYYRRLEYDFLFSPVSLPSYFFAWSLPLLHFTSPPSLCRYVPLRRVSSPVQRLSAPLKYVCFPSNNSNSSLSDLLASFILCFVSYFYFVLSSFCSRFLVLLAWWCSRTRYAG